MQLVFAPTFVAVFFAAMAGVQGVPEEAAARLKAGWADAVVTNYKLWPAAQCVPLLWMLDWSDWVIWWSIDER